MNELIQALPNKLPLYEPSTLSETNEKLLELRMTEMETREEILEYLRQVVERKLWRKVGLKTFTEFCEKELSYSASEIRDIQIKLGLILTSDAMTTPNPVVQARINLLRAWRRDRANMERVAAFRIITNRSLLEIAELDPKTRQEFADIRGIGQAKVDAYSTEILNLLSALRI